MRRSQAALQVQEGRIGKENSHGEAGKHGDPNGKEQEAKNAWLLVFPGGFPSNPWLGWTLFSFQDQGGTAVDPAGTQADGKKGEKSQGEVGKSGNQKERGSGKLKSYSSQYSQAVSHSSFGQAQPC